MKQITETQARKFALADKLKLKQEVRFCMTDWVKENARYIAEIESGQMDKKLYGEWPKGWKVEMKRRSKEKAEQDLIARWIADKCFRQDGALWLGDWQLIQQMEKTA